MKNWMMYPLINHWNVIDIFVCYAVLTLMSQFLGSLTSLYTGVAGESSSLPVVIESRRLAPGDFSTAVASTAIGSAVGGIISIVICLVLSQYLIGVAWFYRTEFAAVLFCLTCGLIVSTTEHTIWKNTLLLATGLVLGLIGWSNVLGQGVLTFGVTDLYQGIPITMFMIMLFAIPQLWQLSQRVVVQQSEPFELKWPGLKWPAMIGHSIVGFVGGLAPGLTTVLSSQLSYNIASRFSTDPQDRILASETANNAGAVSQLLPMLVIGLPLVASEALTLSMMETKGFMATPVAASAIIWNTWSIFVFVSLVGLIIAWPMAKYVLSILKIHGTAFRAAVLLFLFAIAYWGAWQDHSLLFYLFITLALAPLTWLLRKTNTLPLIFGFLISDKLLDVGLRLVTLYS